jgi:hypothetical protein
VVIPQGRKPARNSRLRKSRTLSAMAMPRLFRPAGLTALAAIDALNVTKGTTLLVLGATSGVGSFAVDAILDLVDDTSAINAMADVLRAGRGIVSTIAAAEVDLFAAERYQLLTSASAIRRNIHMAVCARYRSSSNKTGCASSSPRNARSPKP